MLKGVKREVRVRFYENPVKSPKVVFQGEWTGKALETAKGAMTKGYYQLQTKARRNNNG